MPPSAKSQDSDKCKFCKLTIGTSLNPVIKNPSKSDTLKRRAPGSKECSACFGFLKTDTDFGGMTKPALEKHLSDPENQEAYDSAFSDWCKGRRDGKRIRRGWDNVLAELFIGGLVFWCNIKQCSEGF